MRITFLNYMQSISASVGLLFKNFLIAILLWEEHLNEIDHFDRLDFHFNSVQNVFEVLL